MVEITAQELLESIEDGFEKALGATDSILRDKTSMAGSGRLSAKFVYEVSTAIHQCLTQRSPRLRLKVIKVDDEGKKEPGEWLVDACITEEHCERMGDARVPHRFIDRIVLAMESESSTGRQAFNDDFAKLIHLEGKYKLYLNGLDQKTCRGMSKYIKGRCEYVESILKRVQPSGEIYLGFWPSPRKPRSSSFSVDSIWRELQCSEWRHLNMIHLWRFDRCTEKLVKVQSQRAGIRPEPP